MNTAMIKKNLRQFDPEEIARFDCEMWQAYYKHKFVKLFFILFRLARKMHSQFGFSYFRILRATYNLVLSAMDFRLNKGKESKHRILKKLEKAFWLLSNGTIEKFDYKRAAELELEWWLIDRYPARYTMTREEGLALAMGTIYNIEPDKLKEYAHFRAKAMTLQDQAEVEKKEADWQEIESLLVKSFTSLHVAINK